jgi:hypothetical protein
MDQVKIPEVMKSLGCIVSIVESNNVWWAEQIERQYPNNTGRNELAQWLQRAQGVVSSPTSVMSVVKAENEVRFFLCLVDAKVLDWIDPEDDLTWSETIGAAREAIVGKLPEAQNRHIRDIEEQSAVSELRTALRRVLDTCKPTNKVAVAACDVAEAAYLSSFTVAEQDYVVSAARAWQKERAGTGFFQDVELNAFGDVVRNLGISLVHSFMMESQVTA